MNLDDVLGENGKPMRFCDCAELILGEGEDRHRIPCPPGHDCLYCRERSGLVKQAEQIALELVDDLPADDPGRNAKFTSAFARAMQELAEPLLKQKNGASPANA